VQTGISVVDRLLVGRPVACPWHLDLERGEQPLRLLVAVGHRGTVVRRGSKACGDPQALTVQAHLLGDLRANSVRLGCLHGRLQRRGRHFFAKANVLCVVGHGQVAAVTGGRRRRVGGRSRRDLFAPVRVVADNRGKLRDKTPVGGRQSLVR
jgi:hypothetical protein